MKFMSEKLIISPYVLVMSHSHEFYSYRSIGLSDVPITDSDNDYIESLTQAVGTQRVTG